MRRIARSAPAVLALLLILFRPAATLRADDKGCSNANTTAEMQSCESARYTAADQQLNAAYNRLLKRATSEQREPLRAAQRAWVEYRDKNAAFLASAAAGGTLAGVIKLSAMADMTEARTRELEKFGQP